MAQTIKLKNSGTSSNTPSSLEHGELAINYADGKIFYKNSSNSIVEFANLSGSFLPLSGGTLTGNLKLSDGTEFQLGDSSEFKIKHHASGYTHLENTVGTLFIDSDSVTFRDDDGSPTNVLINQSGIDVNGSVVADGLIVGGSVAQAVAGVQVTTSSAIPTGALAEANDGHFSIWNTNASAAYSGLSLRTRTSSSTTALISLDYNSSFNDGELAFRVRDSAGSSDKMLSLKANTVATFSGSVSSTGLTVNGSVSQNYVGIVENTNSTNGYGLLAKTAHP